MRPLICIIVHLCQSRLWWCFLWTRYNCITSYLQILFFPASLWITFVFPARQYVLSASSATRMFFPISFFTCLLGFLFLPLLFNLTRLFPRAPRRTCQHGRAGNETVRCPHFLLLLSFDLLCNSWLSLFPTQLR